jgi:hypothetical protein
MVTRRLHGIDPRTVARDIPGLFDALFPHLAPGLVASLNRRAVAVPGCQAISLNQVAASDLQRAMLFEVAVVAAEQLIDGRESVDWTQCLDVAVARQRKHFDAQLPLGLTDGDKGIAQIVAQNLARMLRYVEAEEGEATLNRSPLIPGYQWIASGVGDFSIKATLIEVKCTAKHFSSADYRQVLMYWILSYAAALEGTGREFVDIVLANPRLNRLLRLSYKELVALLGIDRSKVELLELFASMVADRSLLSSSLERSLEIR